MSLADVIAARLDDADDVVGARLIVDAGPVVLGAVLRAVEAAGPGAHASALPVVARLLESAGVDAIAPLVERGDDLALFAIAALGASRLPAAEPVLRGVVDRALPTARRTALVALARVGGAALVPWLRGRIAAALPDGARTSPDRLLAARDLDPAREVIATAEALAMLGDHELGPLILELATAPRDPHEALRVDAAVALRVVAVPGLVARAAAAVDGSVARAEALVTAIGQIGSAAAARALLEIVAGPRRGAAGAAAWLALALDPPSTAGEPDRARAWRTSLGSAPADARLRGGRPGGVEDMLRALATPAWRWLAALDLELYTGIDVGLDPPAEARRRCEPWIGDPPGQLRRWGQRCALADVE